MEITYLRPDLLTDPASSNILSALVSVVVTMCATAQDEPHSFNQLSLASIVMFLFQPAAPHVSAVT